MTVDDPELGINIMDLGLVYGVDVDEENNVVSHNDADHSRLSDAR